MNYLSINGTKLENAIPGFHSFGITGINMPDTETSTVTVGNRDGVVFRGKRYNGRTINVSFALVCDTAIELIKRFEQLNSFLDQQQAKIILGDEPDVFYIGTKTGLTEPDGARNAMSGTISFLCADPYKYSVAEYTPDYLPLKEDGEYALVDINGHYVYDGSLNKIKFSVPTYGIKYSGTMPSFPTMTAEVKSDMGYIAFINDEDSMIQIGDPEESDGEQFQQNETLINSTFTSAQSAWSATTSAKIPSGIQEGSTKIASVNGKNALTVNSYGSSTSGAHGPAVASTVPADSNSAVGAKNCKFEFSYIFKSSKSAQAGRLVFSIGDTSKSVAAIQLTKKKGSSKGSAELYVNGSLVKTLSFTSGKSNAYTVATASITKYAGTITFVVGGTKYSFTNASIESFVVKRNYIYFAQDVYNKTKTTKANCAAMAMIGVYSAKFIKNFVDKWRDVPNKLAEGDELVVDCMMASIKVNGNDSPGLGALGNDWESFALKPGTNYIGCAYSEWATTEPVFAVKYRKVFI